MIYEETLLSECLGAFFDVAFPLILDGGSGGGVIFRFAFRLFRG